MISSSSCECIQISVAFVFVYVCVRRAHFNGAVGRADNIQHEPTKWAEMSTKNFYANDAIYLRFELNYYTEIVVDLNKVPFLFGHWSSLVDENKRATTFHTLA